MPGAEAEGRRWKRHNANALASMAIVLLVTTLAWVSFKSQGPSDAVCSVDHSGHMDCGPPPPVFQQLHWLWFLLLCVPAVALGVYRVRFTVIRSGLAYGLGVPLAWIAVWTKRVLADPLLREIYLRQIGEAALSGIVIGALMGSLGLLLRYIVGRLVEFRQRAQT